MVDDFKQGRFSGSVPPDDSDPLSTFDFDILTAKKRLSRKGFRQVPDSQHILSAFCLRGKPEMHVIIQFPGLLQPDCFFQNFFSAFCPADRFFPVKLLQPCNDILLVADFRLLFFPRVIHGAAQLCLFPAEFHIISWIIQQFSVFDLHHSGDKTVQKIAVVRNDQHSTAVIGQKVFQPGYGVHIQMVGRLVQNQKIRAGKQETSQDYACLLSAGKRTQLSVIILFMKSKAVQDAVDFALAGIAVVQLKGMREGGIFVHFFGLFFAGGVLHFVFQLTQPCFHIKNRLPCFADSLINGLVAFRILVLCQIADGDIVADGNGSAIRDNFSGNNFQQRGFSGSVYSDQCGLVTALQMKREILKQGDRGK